MDGMGTKGMDLELGKEKAELVGGIKSEPQSLYKSR